VKDGYGSDVMEKAVTGAYIVFDLRKARLSE